MGVDQEDGRACNVVAIDAGSAMPEAVGIDRLQIRIGQNRKIELKVVRHVGILFDPIDTDSDHAGAGGPNRIEM